MNNSPNDSLDKSVNKSIHNPVNNKKNCWEYKKCGRELGGINAFAMGVCPASTYIWFDGYHGGENGGRTCWMITGSMCHGEIHGSFMEKIKFCGRCEFYHKVKEEEGNKIIPSVSLLNKMEQYT